MMNMVDLLVNVLKRGSNPAVRLSGNDNLAHKLAAIIVNSLGNYKREYALSNLLKLIVVNDYRLVAEYLWASAYSSESYLAILQRIIAEGADGRLLYELAHERFQRTKRDEKIKTAFVESLGDIFTFQGTGLSVYTNKHFKAALISLLDATDGLIGDFIEAQYDVPGRNALVRQGVIKSWHLPDGTPVISKRQNLLNRSRFEHEQKNYQLIAQKLPRLTTFKDPVAPKRRVTIQIACPIAVIADGSNGLNYAMFLTAKGVNLEEILVNEQSDSIRASYLTHYRLILDTLYSQGILWGDMSPRNVLVDTQDSTTNYTLVDFEKTNIFNEEINELKRVEHCRGQVCIEEMCVLCPLSEVMSCFKGYFDPYSWDIKSRSIMRSAFRSDMADILYGRGLKTVTEGVYNKLDKAIISVKSPLWSPRKARYLFPGSIGFKVEHYLSCVGYTNASDYDRKTSEVLLAAYAMDCFEEVVDILIDKADALETALAVLEFNTIMSGGYSGRLLVPQKEVVTLVQTIDDLYATRYTTLLNKSLPTFKKDF